MLEYFITRTLYLIQSLLNLYIYLLILRFLLQKTGVSYYNSFIQLLVKLTDFLIKPSRKIIPGFRGYDLATGILIILFQFIAILIVYLFKITTIGVLSGTLLMLIGELGQKTLNIYLIAIIFRVVISWVPLFYNTIGGEITFRLVEPILFRLRSITPSVAGFDFSSLVALFLIYLISTFVFNPLIIYGFSLVNR